MWLVVVLSLFTRSLALLTPMTSPIRYILSSSTDLPALFSRTGVTASNRVLVVTCNPSTTAALQGAPMEILKEAELRNGFVTTCRAHRKLSRPLQAYPVRDIAITRPAGSPPSIAAASPIRWLGITEQWECNPSSLPFFKKQVYEALESVFLDQDTVVFLDTPSTLASASSSIGMALLYLALLCCHPLDCTGVVRAADEVVEVSLPRTTVGLALRGAAFSDAIQQHLATLQQILGHQLSSDVEQFIQRTALCVLKERAIPRGMAGVTNSLQHTLSQAQTSAGACAAHRLPNDGLRVLELFSGIGGMHLALRAAGVKVTQCNAFDCSAIPCKIYTNYFHKDVDTRSIETLHAVDLQGYDLLTLSPPCQPYTTTRYANQRDHLDNRSKPLAHIISLLLACASMGKLPKWIVLENVQGFVGSKMHSLWLSAMSNCGYEIEQFLLTPQIAVGLPNARKRYYMLATHRGAGSVGKAEETAAMPDMPSAADAEEDEGSGSDSEDEISIAETPVGVQTSLPGATPIAAADVQTIGSLLAMPSASFPISDMSQLLVSRSTLSASWAVKGLSVARPSDRLTFCFTKGYGKLVDRSAGSCYLDPSLSGLTDEPLDRANLPSYEGKIRLFHPNELLRFFGFPEDFTFPAGMPLRQQYNCIGNSINVAVVGQVMAYLFAKQ